MTSAIDFTLLLPLCDLRLQGALALLLVVLLAALWRWRWRDYRLPTLPPREAPDAPPAAAAAPSSVAAELIPGRQRPRVSLVVPACNAAEALQRHLPIWLSLPTTDYEVIVVDEASTDETRDVIRRFMKESPRLRFTFVPTEARSTDRRKLAITLGIRAARAPWVVLTEADCRPATPQWLDALQARFSDDVDFVIGYARYDDADSRLRYSRLLHQLHCFRSARGRAIGGDVDNLALRKDYFLQQGGYSGILGTGCGEGDLLIDALALPRRTAVAPCRAAAVIQELPSPHLLRVVRRQQRRALHFLSRRGRRYLLRDAAATAAAWLFLVGILAYVALRLLRLAVAPVYAPADIALDALVVALLVLFFLLPSLFLRRATAVLGEAPFPLLRVAAYQWRA
jgi:glycosyltransferase involved in cell wall biosynthesis